MFLQPVGSLSYEFATTTASSIRQLLSSFWEASSSMRKLSASYRPSSRLPEASLP